MAFRLAYSHLTLTHSKGQGQRHAHSTVNISQKMTDMANVTIAPNIMLHVGFRLAYLELTSTCLTVNLALETASNKISWPSY